MKNVKKDFPIFQKNKKLVYLDSAATSQKPKVVIDAIKNYYETYNANVRRGLYPIAEKATEKVEGVRRQVAKFINAKDPSEIIFVRNATEGINLVAYALSNDIKEGDSIVTTIMEHHSNFVPWQQLAKLKKAKFEVIDFGENFQFSIFNFQSNPNVQKAKVLAITHVSNVLGTINPIKEIIRKVRAINPHIKILVDAAQSVPHMQVDVQDLDCDFLAFSGHKMMAGTGIGVLYGKKKLLKQMQPFLYGGEMIREVGVGKTTFADIPYKFEAGTPNIADVIAFRAALDYVSNVGLEKITQYENELLRYATEALSKIPGLRIIGTAKHKASVISFVLNEIHPHDIGTILDREGIAIRAGHHCAMPIMERFGIPATARASFAFYNTKEEIDRLVEGIQTVLEVFES